MSVSADVPAVCSGIGLVMDTHVWARACGWVWGLPRQALEYRRQSARVVWEPAWHMVGPSMEGCECGHLDSAAGRMPETSSGPSQPSRGEASIIPFYR